jgi:putative peptide modification system cyclase
VYSISADGVGKQSVLPSLDSVSKQLRGKLGEALAMVSKQSMPLAKVATPNLHALRAYSLGERAYNSVDLEQAEVLFDQALKIDPHFALAHVELAKIFASRNESAKMLEQIHAAQTDRARLSPREELYVDAWAENSLAPRQALAKWKLLASVYPDYFAGLGTYAFCLWNDSNDFVNAATYFKQAASGKNPHRGIDLYMLGAMYAEAGRYVDAVRAFSAAVADGLHSPLTNYASVYAAQREFAQASRVLKQSGVTSTNLADVGMRLAMELDQGRWRTAEEMLATAQTQANSESQRVAEGYALVRLGLQALDGTSDKAQVSALADYLGRMRGALDHVNLAERGDFEFRIAMVGYFAARAGDVSLARRALTLIDAKPGDTWLLANMRGVAAAETELAAGRARDAIMALKAQVKGNELYVTHVALMDAYASVGDYAQALTEARWVAAQRGRAYFENSVSQYLTPFNVTESNLALLSQAQFSLASGDKAGAHTALETFARVWPGMTNKGFVAMRYQKLARQL